MIISNHNNSSNLYFGIKISDAAVNVINRQLRNENKRTKKLAIQQFENIKNWEHENSKLVLARNSEGNIQLGLEYQLNQFVKGIWAFEHLNSRTVLSSFLKLKENHIDNTIKNILFIYEKHGPQIFNQKKVETIYDKIRTGKI